MNHLAVIQSEFLKISKKWEDLSYEEQKGYLSRHPKTRRKLTAILDAAVAHEPVEVTPENMEQKKQKEFKIDDKVWYFDPELNSKSFDDLNDTENVGLVDANGEQKYIKKLDLKPKPQEQKPIEIKSANSMTKAQIYKLLSDNMHSTVSYSNKKGGFVFKKGYYWGGLSGSGPEKFAESVSARTRRLGLTPKIVDTSNHWNAWPKDSWFEAVISFDQMKKSTPKEWNGKGLPQKGQHVYVKGDPEVGLEPWDGIVVEVNNDSVIVKWKESFPDDIKSESNEEEVRLDQLSKPTDVD